MALPWEMLERVETPEGVLELRRRGKRDFLITIAGRVLMSSSAHRSEDALARMAIAEIAGVARPRVLVAGLGLGLTLRAALDVLPGKARVEVVELNAQVVAWCRGPLGVLTGDALGDARVRVEIADVGGVIARAQKGSFDAIVLDLYEGPYAGSADQVFGVAALGRAYAALAPGGVIAVWSEQADRGFEQRLQKAGFKSEVRRPPGTGHSVYLGHRVRSSR